MIHVENLSFAYPGGDPVLENIGFSLPKGGFLCLAGANGSGKSTLLCLMAGLYTPTSGKVVAAGAVNPGMEEDVRHAARLVMQDFDHQIIGATPEEDLLLGRDETDPVVRQRTRDMANRFDLGHCLDSPVQTLSGGQKRKLALCGALLDNPAILLFDEPFSGLDYPAVKEMRRAFACNMAKGITQVAAVHSVDAVADLVTDWVVLSQGRIGAAGSLEAVIPRLEEFGVRRPDGWAPETGIASWEAR